MSEKFTNNHFVEFLKKFKGNPYWYGTTVVKCTTDLYTRKKAQYPAHYTSSRTAQYNRDIANNKVCADCIGLLKGYFWTNGGEGVFEGNFKNSYQSNGCPDRSANGFFSYAKSQGMDWGTIDTIPEIPGIAVRYDGHVGYYIGNGRVIEERGFKYGCVETALAGRGWLNWYKIPGIKYDESSASEPVEPTKPIVYKLGERTLRKGMQGDDVKELQEGLMKIGYSLPKYGADGDFGGETETAVKSLQTKAGLTADGIYGANTHKALMEALADDEPDPEPIIPVEKTAKLVVSCDSSARIRSGDSTNYNIITTVKKGTMLTPIFDTSDKPIQSSNKWYAVKINNVIGWISGDLVKGQ